jgi:signal transduction histidine kinase
MASIPLSIAKYVRSMWIAEMIMTYLQIDKKGHLIKWGGHPQHYGLTDLTTGKLAVEQLHFLEGLIDIPYTQVLQFVQLGRGRSADVHIIPFDKGTYVLIVDVTAEHDRQQKMQQQVNELSILTYRQSQLLQELEMARQQLAEEKHQLEKVSQLKSDFISSLSHELRTPLTSIVGYTKLLDEVQQADAREADYLSSVKNNANHLLSLIDNVLEQTKIETGQIILQPSGCDIKQLLADLKSLFFPMAQEKGLLFDIGVQGYLPRRVMIDELRFRQILINLITNALKFTEKGFVKVELGWQVGHLTFSIVDSGPGISEKAQRKIFTAFHREQNAQEQSGAGLGLAISHHLVTLMNGQLTVEYSSQFGAIFKGTVPAPLTHTTKNRETLISITQTGTKILIAEDSVDLRTLMETYLEQSGYTIISANNGEEVLELALQTQPDLILMDMQMPVMNGYEAAQQLREQNFTNPIIALSGSIIIQDRNYALKLGCDDYIVKPISPDELLNRIKKMLNQS